jgi:hypothetical protein
MFSIFINKVRRTLLKFIVFFKYNFFKIFDKVPFNLQLTILDYTFSNKNFNFSMFLKSVLIDFLRRIVYLIGFFKEHFN